MATKQFACFTYRSLYATYSRIDIVRLIIVAWKEPKNKIFFRSFVVATSSTQKWDFCSFLCKGRAGTQKNCLVIPFVSISTANVHWKKVRRSGTSIRRIKQQPPETVSWLAGIGSYDTIYLIIIFHTSKHTSRMLVTSPCWFTLLAACKCTYSCTYFSWHVCHNRIYIRCTY